VTREETPTKQQWEWAGKVWNASLFAQCEAFAWAAFGYADLARALAEKSWQDIGAANQMGIVQTMLDLEQNMRRAHR
jgi:hypothetical protein